MIILNIFSSTKSILVLKVLLHRAHLGVTPYRVTSRTHFFFKIYVNYLDILMVFSLFWNTVAIMSILPSERPFGALTEPKTNYMLLFNNFSTPRLILDLKVVLNRARLGVSPKNNFQDTFFSKFTSIFLMVFNLFWDTVTIACRFPSERSFRGIFGP